MAEEKLIQDDFYEASYFGIAITYQKSSGYVNATKLCSNCNKQYYHWKTNKHSMVLFHEFTKCYNSTQLPEYQVYNGDLQLRGSYVHPDLVASIAMWIDPRFHLRVAQLLRSIHEIQLSLMVQKHEVEKQDMEFTHLVEMTAAQEPCYPESYFLIFNKNSSIDPYPYKVVKCMKSLRNTCMNRIIKDFPRATIVMDTMFRADGKELLQRMRLTLKDKITFNHNNFKLHCDENDALHDIYVLINH